MPGPGTSTQKPSASQIFARSAIPAPLQIARSLTDFLAGLGREPQKPNEPRYVAGLRRTEMAPFMAADAFLDTAGQDIKRSAAYAMETGAEINAKKRAATGQPSAPFDTSIEGLTEGLINRGIPGYVARGVAAGLIAESRGDPAAFNPAGGGQGALGLSQWRGPRQEALKAQYGNNPTPDQQLDFLAYELKGGDPGGASVMSARTPAEALQSFVHNFLRPGEGATGDLQRGFAALGGKMLENVQSPFDPRFAEQALGSLEQSRQAALLPASLPFNAGPMPEVPKPTPVPKMDWSKADADLEAMKPVEMTVKEAEGMRWKNFWGGLGQAMMSSPEGEGLGSFFLRLGGAGLASVGQTMSEIQAKKEQYETKLAKWQGALYEHDLTKADSMQRELMADWQNDQNWAMKKYEQGMNVWLKTAFPTISGTDLVTTHLNPETGEGSVTRTPFKNAVNSAYAMEKANVLMQVFSADQSSNAQAVGIKNRYWGNMAMAVAGEALADEKATAQEKSAAASFGLVPYVNGAVDYGLASQILGEEEYERASEEITRELAPKLTYGSKGYDEAFNDALKMRLLLASELDAETRKRLVGAVGNATTLFEEYNRYSARKERTTTNAKGQQSTVVEEGGE